jgi:hypothetical protein
VKVYNEHGMAQRNGTGMFPSEGPISSLTLWLIQLCPENQPNGQSEMPQMADGYLTSLWYIGDDLRAAKIPDRMQALSRPLKRRLR